MKKHLVLITIALIMNVCTWTGCGNDTPTGKEAANEEAAPGQETAPGQEATPGQESADASTASPEQSTKPSLIIVEEESGDYRQAAKARITASEDAGDDMISPIMAETSADGPAKVSEPGQNTANTKETANSGKPAAEKEYTVMV